MSSPSKSSNGGHPLWRRPTKKKTEETSKSDKDGAEKEKEKPHDDTRFMDKKGRYVPGKSRRAWLCGIEMNSNQAARILDINKYSHWSWFFYLTPWCMSTVFNRPGLHIMVFIYVAIGNIVYFYIHKKYANLGGLDNVTLPFDSNIVRMQMNWARILITFSLTTYVSKIVDTYWKGTRSKVSALVRYTSKVVDTMIVTVDYSSPRSELFLTSLHKMLTAAVEYAFAVATNGTKFKLSKEEMADLFEQRGFDSKYFLALPVKQSIHVLRSAILQSMREEREQPDGCLREMDSVNWDTLRSDIAELSGAAMSTMTSTKSTKLPFSYVAIVNWGVRVMAFCFTMYTYMGAAQQEIESGTPMPFTCWEREPYCHTKFYLWANVGFIFCLYYIFGLLEIYYSVAQRIWQDGLVKSSYIRNINSVCQFLLEKPKTFSELEVQAEESQVKEEVQAEMQGTVEAAEEVQAEI